jgi:hypothetical protein
MADTSVSDLDREQIGWLDKIIGVIGDPVIAEDVSRMVIVLECARSWYLQRRQQLRGENA